MEPKKSQQIEEIFGYQQKQHTKERVFDPRLCNDIFMFQRHPIQNEHLMFITTNVHYKKPIFADPAHARAAVDMLYKVHMHHPFDLYGFVIMPDHCHFLMNVTWPETISRVMRVYKMGLTFELGIGAFWQSRFHMIIPKNGFNCLRYIHKNPVRAGLVPSQEEYPWSSASGKWKVMEFM